MRTVLFTHSLLSDWNHGSAHFLRGVARELLSRGHAVEVYEPHDSASLADLMADRGQTALDAFRAAYPGLSSTRYDLDSLDLESALDGADLVLVHERNAPELVRRLSRLRARADGFRLLFHDTHHRAVTAPAEVARLELSRFDAVLVSGEALRGVYLERGWAGAAFSWHEAADTRVFRPMPRLGLDGHLVFVGNWGDGERSAELSEFVLEPARALGLRGSAYGVRYPPEGNAAFQAAGLTPQGFLPNPEVPRVSARHCVTVHVPRRPYARALPGVPTIRVFEALACGIPMVSAPWDDAEALFRPGKDYLVARSGAEMRRQLQDILEDASTAAELRANGLATIRARHTVAHRVDRLLEIAASLGVGAAAPRLAVERAAFPAPAERRTASA